MYDDACHLWRFAQGVYKDNPTPRLKNFISKLFIVDKLHIQGHDELWCDTHCNPRKFRELDEINTMVCEQQNYLIGGFKYILKHMQADTYNFYLYIYFNEFNKLKILNHYELTSQKPNNTYKNNVCI